MPSARIGTMRATQLDAGHDVRRIIRRPDRACDVQSVVGNVVDEEAVVGRIETDGHRHVRVRVGSRRRIAIGIGEGRTAGAVRHRTSKLLGVVAHEVVARRAELEIRHHIRMLVVAIIDDGDVDAPVAGIGKCPRARRVDEVVVPVLNSTRVRAGEAQPFRARRGRRARVARRQNLLAEHGRQLDLRLGTAAEQPIDVDGRDRGIRAQRGHGSVELRPIAYANARGAYRGGHIGDGEERRRWLCSEPCANRRADLARAFDRAHGHRAELPEAERLAAKDDVDPLSCPRPMRCHCRERRTRAHADEIFRRNACVSRIDRYVSDDAPRRRICGVTASTRRRQVHKRRTTSVRANEGVRPCMPRDTGGDARACAAHRSAGDCHGDSCTMYSCSSAGKQDDANCCGWRSPCLCTDAYAQLHARPTISTKDDQSWPHGKRVGASMARPRASVSRVR